MRFFFFFYFALLLPAYCTVIFYYGGRECLTDSADLFAKKGLETCVFEGVRVLFANLFSFFFVLSFVLRFLCLLVAR